MSQASYLFTSESVSEGHPDKVCDRISDTVVDLYLGADPGSRVACETLATTNKIVLAGEVRGPSRSEEHTETASLENVLHEQSADIAVGVDAAGNKDEGAGDQGIMFGYACTETDVLMPAPIHFSHEILRRMAVARKDGSAKGLGPDSKSQVTLQYENGKPVRCTSVVVSTQHAADLSQDEVHELVLPFVREVMPEGWVDDDTVYYINPTGRFVIGGPDGDCGLTGRKIIVDTYGGAAPHGGGAFSGKDPTKVDRSAAYAARWVAKNVVAAGLAEKCVLQVSYAIGVSHPLSIFVDTYGTNTVDEEKLSTVISEMVDLSPRGIRERLKLSNPIYAPSAAYGHFGRKPDDAGRFTWERLDLVDELKSAF